MMRGPKMSAMAVRDPQGEIVLEKFETKVTKRAKIFRLPVIRGIFNFIDSMTMGYKCLMRSAEISGLDALEEELAKEKAVKKAAKKAAKKAKKGEIAQSVVQDAQDATDEQVAQDTASQEEQSAVQDVPAEKKKESSALMNTIMVISSVLGVVLAVVLFTMLPTYLYHGLLHLVPSIEPDSEAARSLLKSFFESVLRIALLVGYMALVSLMKDIRRTFQYHGAEHKTIFCYEHGQELTVENVRREGRFHPRCGTSFLILMLIVGMFISFLIDPISIWLTGKVPPTLLRTLIKIILLPLTMGLGYELIKLAGRHDNLFTRIISAPGMWLQHITVLEPDDSMIECAIAAFVEVIPEDESDKIQ